MSSPWWLVLLIALGGSAAIPAASQGADPATAPKATKKQADEAREKIWNSAEMLQARAWLEGYFRVAKKYTPQQAAEYRQALQNMSAPEMELWLMKFEHDREMSRAQEAAWNQQRQAGLASDEAALAQERKALGNVNRDENKAAAVAEKGIVEQREEAERNYRQNASAQDSFMNNEFNRPYAPYGYYGPSSVHYHYHR